MKKVLIVSPHFPPVNAPDMQRVRMALPWLRGLGWEPVVLAVKPERVEGAVLEPLLLKTFPQDVRVVRVGGIPYQWSRRFGLGSLWFRCGQALHHAGDRLLAQERFDMVLFSTTQFGSFVLGPKWRKRFGVPYVLDYQDPWVNSYYDRHGLRPPGGSVKYGIIQKKARWQEPGVVHGASGIMVVSKAYIHEMISRYPDVDESLFEHIPFGAARADFEVARHHRPITSRIPFGDGKVHLVYTGRCGPDMSLALGILFKAFRRYKESHPGPSSRLRFHFIGTDYAPPPKGKYWAMPHAENHGVAGHVSEHCQRVPYFDALYYLLHADGLLVVGSNDSSYSASKIFPYLMAERPMLTIVHEKSQMLSIARASGRPHSYGFMNDSGTELNDALCQRVYDEWFVSEAWKSTHVGTDEVEAPYSARNLTVQLVHFLDRALTARTRNNSELCP